MKRWLAVGLGVPTLALAGMWALTPDAALKSWGHGFIDQRASAPETWSALDDALDLRLDQLAMVRPDGVADVAAPLVARWAEQQDLRFHMGPTYADGVRAVHIEYACAPGAAPKGQRVCGASVQALPVRCPDPSEARRCYHVPVKLFSPVQFHAAVTLEAVKGGWVRAEGSVLSLVVKADALRRALNTVGLGPVLEKIDGLTVPEGLTALEAKADLDVNADGDAEGWALEFEFGSPRTATCSPPPAWAATAAPSRPWGPPSTPSSPS